MRQIEDRIRQFISNNLLFGDGSTTFSNDESFLERGIIDSTAVLELVAFIETEYAIKVKDSELIPANLDSVNKLVQFVNSKIQLAPSTVSNAG
jgi:acyl carrier protein